MEKSRWREANEPRTRDALRFDPSSAIRYALSCLLLHVFLPYIGLNPVYFQEVAYQATSWPHLLTWRLMLAVLF